MNRFYILLTLFFTVLILDQGVSMAQIPAVHFEYTDISSGKTSIQILTPVFEEPWNPSDRCDVAGKELYKALKKTGVSDKPVLNCTGNSVSVKLPGVKKGQLDQVLPVLYYTLRWYGLDTISVSKLHPRPLKMMELTVPAVTVVMPFWVDLPPSPALPGMLVTDKGQWLDAMDFRRGLQRGDKTAVNILKAGLQSKLTQERLAVLAALPTVKGLDIVTLAGPLLQDPSTGVRMAVVRLLQGVKGPSAIKMLEDMAGNDKSVTIRIQAARILSKRGDHKFDNIAAVDDINSTDPKVAIHAIDVLLAHPVKGVGPVLLSAMDNPSRDVAAKALSALIKLGLTKQLVTVLSDPNLPGDMKLQSARYLAGLKDQKPRVEGLRYLLKHGNDKDKIMACNRVLRFKDRDLAPALLNDLANKPGKEAQSALDALVALGDPALIKPMVGLIKGTLADKVSKAVVKLIDTLSVDKVLKMTSDSNPVVRMLAVQVLGLRLKGRATIPPNIGNALGKALKDSSIDVRRQAAAALAKSDDQKQLRALCGLASDQDHHLRAIACMAAAKVGGTTGQAILLSGLNDTSDDVRLAALKGIAKLKIRKAMPVLVTLGNYQNTDVRRMAYKALTSMLKPDEVLKYRGFLIQGLTDRDKQIKRLCLQALRGVKDRKVILAVGDMKIDPDKTIRMLAIAVLAAAGTPDAIDALESMATIDENPEVRVSALKALAKLNKPDLVDFLKELLKHEEDQGGSKAVINAAKAILKSLAL